jgi:hypothetical protein
MDEIKMWYSSAEETDVVEKGKLDSKIYIKGFSLESFLSHYID